MNIQTPHRSPRRTPKCPSHPQHPRSTVPNYTHLVMNQWVRSCKNQSHASLFSNLFGSPFQPKLLLILGLVLQVQGFNGHLMYSQSGWNRNIICPGFQITAIQLQSISANSFVSWFQHWGSCLFWKSLIIHHSATYKDMLLNWKIFRLVLKLWLFCYSYWGLWQGLVTMGLTNLHG